MSIAVSIVKKLREKTGAGMMDCKKALIESDQDFESAIDWLRKKGLSIAAKKSSRPTAEGLTAYAINGKKGAVIEVNSETDFISRNKVFQSLVKEVVEIAVGHTDIRSLKLAKTISGRTVEDEIMQKVSIIGENLKLSRMQSVRVSDGVIVSYVHNSTVDGMGKISTLVALESDGNKEQLMSIGKQLAMHVAATNPQSLNIEGVGASIIQREKDIFIEQSKSLGKADNIIKKMVDGRIRKFFQETVLMEQIFVIDGKTKISELVNNFAEKLGTKVTIKDFIRFEVGESLEKDRSKT